MFFTTSDRLSFRFYSESGKASFESRHSSCRSSSARLSSSWYFSVLPRFLEPIRLICCAAGLLQVACRSRAGVLPIWHSPQPPSNGTPSSSPSCFCRKAFSAPVPATAVPSLAQPLKHQCLKLTSAGARKQAVASVAGPPASCARRRPRSAIPPLLQPARHPPRHQVPQHPGTGIFPRKCVFCGGPVISCSSLQRLRPTASRSRWRSWRTLDFASPPSRSSAAT